MSEQAAQSHRRKLLGVDVPAAQAAAITEQIKDILGFHVERFSARVPVDQQMKALAFDCYTQGLLDGQQVQVQETG